MNDLNQLFRSPELYPLAINFQKQLVVFVRMSPETYRESVFLDLRTRRVEKDIYQFRIDDVLLASADAPTAKRVHYILHTAFCCSTLLARYFELIPHCFVLKEPRLLTEMALTPQHAVPRWDEAFDLSLKLLLRTYHPEEYVVIKTHEPCNPLGRKLLECNEQATITFLMTPMRQFLLAVLKSEERRAWVRTRIKVAAKYADYAALVHINPDDLSDSEAAAFLWLVNRFLCEQLSAEKNRSRVLVVDGRQLAADPEPALTRIAAMCALPLGRNEIQALIDHPSVRQHSKQLSKLYDALSRHHEMIQLEEQWGVEADAGTDWAASLDIERSLVEEVL